MRELIWHLERHACEIIDHKRRMKAGKAIGSGRMERAVGVRRKKRGMSWSEEGSRALPLLRVVEPRGGWERLWDAARVAA